MRRKTQKSHWEKTQKKTKQNIAVGKNLEGNIFVSRPLLAQRLQSPVLYFDDNKAYEVIWY